MRGTQIGRKKDVTHLLHVSVTLYYTRRCDHEEAAHHTNKRRIKWLY